MAKYPQAVEGIQAWLLFSKKGENIYCVGSKKRDKYIKVNEYHLQRVLDIINMMDGSLSIEEFKKAQNGEVIIEQLVEVLTKANLLENIIEPLTLEKNEYEKFSLKIINFQFNESINTKLQKLSDMIIKKVVIIPLIVFIIVTCSLFSPILIRALTSPDTYIVTSNDLLNIVLYFSLATFSTLLHEFSHALFAERYRCPPLEFILALYFVTSPIVYLKIPGLYTIDRLKRIYVWSAGIFMNLFLISISLWGYLATSSNIFMLTVALNTMFAIVNLCPFFMFDGYFFLSNLIKETNIRKKMMRIIINQKLPFKGNFIGNIFAIVSLIVLIIFVVSQISWVFRYVNQAIEESYDFGHFLLNIRYLIFLIVWVIVSTIMKKRKK